MQSVARTIKTIKKQILDEMNHPFLKEQLDTPMIDDGKLFLLISMLNEQNLPKEKIEIYATTVALIQIALDTHDRVENGIEFKSNQKMQLTVLAGDYFSSLYYQTLAIAGNIEFIKLLSEGIQLVNENKMIVYNREAKTYAEFMDSTKLIATTIFQKVAEYFQDNFWQRVGTIWLHLNHLLQHKKWYVHYLLENEIPVTDHEITVHTEAVEEALDSYIENLYETLYAHLSEKPHYNHLLEISTDCPGKRFFAQ